MVDQLIRRTWNNLLYREGDLLVLNSAASQAAFEDCCCGGAGCCPAVDIPATLTATLGTGGDQSGCAGLVNETFNLVYNGVTNKWEGSGDLACGDRLELDLFCYLDTDQVPAAYVFRLDGRFKGVAPTATAFEEATDSDADYTCDPYSAEFTLLVPTGEIGSTNCCSSGDNITVLVEE